MKLYVVTAKKLLSSVLVFAALLAAICLNYNQAKSVFNNESSRKLPIYNVQRDDKVCAISFDAAWGDTPLRKIADIFLSYIHKIG